MAQTNGRSIFKLGEDVVSNPGNVTCQKLARFKDQRPRTQVTQLRTANALILLTCQVLLAGNLFDITLTTARNQTTGHASMHAAT